MKRMNKILSIFLVLSIIIAPISMASTDVTSLGETIVDTRQEVKTIEVESAIIVFDENGEYEVKLEPQEVTIDKKEGKDVLTVFDSLGETTDEYEYSDSDYGVFVTSILGVTPPANGGWMFTVNDEELQVGVGEAEIKEGDKILWYCTYNWERDKAPTWKELLGEEPVEEIEKKFKDLSKHPWAEEAIETMARKGIINGISKDKFAPTANITRAEFATLVSRMLKYDESSVKEIPFKDVNPDKYYYNSISAIYENGLINGKTETTFDPEGLITRQEMAKIIGKILMNNSYTMKDIDVLSPFSDSDSISSWAINEANLVVHNEIILGSNGKFLPKGQATRAEAAVMLYRLDNLLLD